MDLKTLGLRQELDRAQRRVPIDTVWQHKKGGVYVVLGHTIDTDDGQVRVRYRRVGGYDHDPIAERSIEFVRPLFEFSQESRFTRVE